MVRLGLGSTLDHARQPLELAPFHRLRQQRTQHREDVVDECSGARSDSASFNRCACSFVIASKNASSRTLEPDAALSVAAQGSVAPTVRPKAPPGFSAAEITEPADVTALKRCRS